jgi:hypothetical protein
VARTVGFMRVSNTGFPSPGASRMVRGVVWVLAVLVVSAAVLSPSEAVPAASSVPVSAAGVSTAPVLLLAADGDTQQGSARVPSIDSTNGPRDCDLRKATDSCFWRYANEPTGLLPAWRWRDDVGLFQNTSITDFLGLPAMMSFIATFFFTLAGLLWWILLAICEWVFTSEVLESSWQTINNGFAATANVVWSSGVFILGAAVAAVVAIRHALRFKFGKAIGALLTFALPMAAISVLAIGAGDRNTGSDPPAMSPAWIAIKGSQKVDEAVAGVGSGFGLMSRTGTDLVKEAAEVTNPSCEVYTAGLYDQYYAYSSPQARDILSNARKAYAEAYESAKVSTPRGWVVPPSVQRDIIDKQIAAVSTGLESYNFQSARAQAGLSGKLSSASAAPVATISMLWERAFLSSWTAAQFGSPENGRRAYCHLLENNAGISRTEQVMIANVATEYAAGPSYEGINPFAFGKKDGDKVTEQRVFAWMACARDESNPVGWRAEPGWKALGEGHGLTDENCADYFDATRYQALLEAGEMEQGTLSKVAGFFGSALGYFSPADALVAAVSDYDGLGNEIVAATTDYSGTGDMVSQEVQTRREGSDTNDANGNVTKLRFDTMEDLQAAVVNSNQEEYPNATAALAACGANGEGGGTDGETECAAVSARDVEEAVMSFWGHNSTQRISHGAMALATSVVYVYSLGMLAVGAMIAKFGLVLMLAILPLTLFALALPSTRRSATHGSAPGMKLLKMTGGFFLANVMLGLFMTMLIGTILILEGLFNSGNGAILSAVAPLVALFLLKKLFEQMGFGSITSAGGAIGLPLAVAAGAGDKNWKNQAKGMFSNQNSRLGKSLAKGDALAKRTAKKAALMPAAGVWWGAKKAGKGVSDKYALGDRKKQLLGAKDEKGNLTELGLAQRLGSLAGVIDLAKNGKRTGAFAERMLATKPGGVLNSLARSGVFLDSVAKSSAAADQMKNRRALIDATSGKNAEGRRKARQEFMEDRLQEAIENIRCVRDANGNPILDADGRRVFGFTANSPQGPRTFQSLDAAIAQGFQMADLIPITDLSDVTSPASVIANGLAFAQHFGLREDQYRVGIDGFEPVPSLVLSGSNGGIPMAKSMEQTVELVDKHRTMMMTDNNKKQIMALGPIAQARAIALTETYLGSVDESGRRVSAFEQMGIDPHSDVAKAEVLKKINGQPSILDQFQQDIPQDTMLGIIAAAQDYERKHEYGFIDSLAEDRNDCLDRAQAARRHIEVVRGETETLGSQLLESRRAHENAKKVAAQDTQVEELKLSETAASLSDATAARDAATAAFSQAGGEQQFESQSRALASAKALQEKAAADVATLDAELTKELADLNAELAKISATEKALSDRGRAAPLLDNARAAAKELSAKVRAAEKEMSEKLSAASQEAAAAAAKAQSIEVSLAPLGVLQQAAAKQSTVVADLESAKKAAEDALQKKSEAVKAAKQECAVLEAASQKLVEDIKAHALEITHAQSTVEEVTLYAQTLVDVEKSLKGKSEIALSLGKIEDFQRDHPAVEETRVRGLETYIESLSTALFDSDVNSVVFKRNLDAVLRPVLNGASTSAQKLLTEEGKLRRSHKSRTGSGSGSSSGTTTVQELTGHVPFR